MLVANKVVVIVIIIICHETYCCFQNVYRLKLPLQLMKDDNEIPICSVFKISKFLTRRKSATITGIYGGKNPS